MYNIEERKISWIGKIPENWELKKIKYILKDRNENNNPIRSTDILSLTAKQGVIPIAEKEGGGNKPKEDFSAYKLAYPGDIVLNSMNILSGSVGLSKYFGCVSPVYYMLRPIDNNNDVRYFNYIFQTEMFQKSLLGLGNGILMKESDNGKYNTIRMRIPLSKLNDLYIPISSKEEQKKISDVLDKKCNYIDSISKEIEQQIEKIETYKRSLISECVMFGIDKNYEKKDSNIFYVGNINANWSIKKIGYICKKLNRSFKSEDIPLICSNQGKVLIRPDDVRGKMVSEDNAMQGIKKGDIAIHGMDTWHGAIAVSNFNGKITRVVHVCETTQDKRYVTYYLQHLAFQGVYKLISNGVRGNTSDFRSWEKVRNIYIPIPSKEEQRKISDYLDNKNIEIDNIIEFKKKQLDILEKYKTTLIYEYVTGKKEVSE